MHDLSQFEYSVRLECQSPIIHFQHDKPGAILRVTEVKPKLDRFLISKISDIPKEWYVKEGQKALDYKMRIETHGDVIKGEPHKIFYGNTGVKDKNLKKYTIKGDCDLTVVCFHEKLLDYIKKYIAEFFIVTNFGTMQGKGFGSFIPQNTKTIEKQNAAYLCEAANAPVCYMIKFRNNDTKYMFNTIKNLCSAMKSYGDNSIGGYFNSQTDIKNEVKWRKAGYPTSGNYKYTRALFGIGSTLGDLPVKHVQENIDRFPFPIFFKIIGNNVYFVANEIDSKIYDTEFDFGGHKIKTPKESEFTVDDYDYYIDWFVEKYKRSNRNIVIVDFERK